MEQESLDITQVEGMAKTISEYGLAIVVAAVFLIVVLAFMFFIIRKWGDQMKEQSTLNQTIMNTFVNQNQKLLEIFTERPCLMHDHEHSADSEVSTREEHKSVEIAEQAVLNRKINELVMGTREEIKADRIDFYIFSNGQKSLGGGYRFLKYSKMFTSVRRGSPLQSLTEFPVSYFPNFFDTLHTTGSMVYWDIRKMEKEYPTSYVWINTTGAHGFVVYMVKEGAIPLGFITAMYEDSPESQEEQASDAKVLKDLANKLSVLINKEEV